MNKCFGRSARWLIYSSFLRFMKCVSVGVQMGLGHFSPGRFAREIDEKNVA